METAEAIRIRPASSDSLEQFWVQAMSDYKNQTLYKETDNGGNMWSLVWKVALPVILTTGVVGNTLLIFVSRQMRSEKRVYTTMFNNLLTLLALSDTLSLVTSVIRVSIDHYQLPPIEDMYRWSCRLFPFINVSATQFAAWVLCLLTVDRMIHFSHPFLSQTKPFFQGACQKISIVILILLAIGINAPVLFLVDLQPISGNTSGIEPATTCIPTEENMGFLNIYAWVHLTSYSILPFLLLLVCNTLVLRRINQRDVISKHVYIPRQERTRKSLIHRLRNLHERRSSKIFFPAASAQNSPAPGTNPPLKARSSMSQAKFIRKSAIMILPSNFVHITCTLPATVTYILSYTNYFKANDLETAYNIGEMLVIINHALNFFLLGISGREFRNAFLKLIGCPGAANQRPVTDQTTHYKTSRLTVYASSVCNSPGVATTLAKPVLFPHGTRVKTYNAVTATSHSNSESVVQTVSP